MIEGDEGKIAGIKVADGCLMAAEKVTESAELKDDERRRRKIISIQPYKEKINGRFWAILPAIYLQTTRSFVLMIVYLNDSQRPSSDCKILFSFSDC